MFTGRPKWNQQLDFVNERQQALLAWFAALPTELKLDIDRLPDQCPPPHILGTNAMYRTAWILL
jgi:hypothetical protein